MKDLSFKKNQMSQILYALSVNGIIHSLIYEFYFDTNYLSSVPIGCALLALAFNYISLKFNFHIEMYGNLLIFLFYLGVTLSIVFAGGLDSAILAWLAIIPIICSTFFSMRSTVSWCLIATITSIIVGLLPSSFFSTLNEIKMEDRKTFQALLFFDAIIICSIISIFIKKRKADFENQLDHFRQISFQQAKLSSLGELAAGISHEINNPLAIIKGLNKRIERSLRDSPYHEKLERDFTRIDETIHRIGKIVASLRKLGRAEKSKGFCDLNEVLKDLVNISAEKLRNHGIRLDIIKHNSPNFVQGDEIAISQVLINLLNNSFDEIKEDQNPWIKIEVCHVDEFTTIFHTDSGLGISENIAKKMFDPFYTTKEVGKGTGIGLSISKSIMQKTGGDLTYNKNSKNTCFEVTFRNLEN